MYSLTKLASGLFVHLFTLPIHFVYLLLTFKTMQELKDTLQVYEPRMETNVTAANILLIGQIGAGKSSFFNSVDSIFRGRVTNKACSGSSERSITTMV